MAKFSTLLIGHELLPAIYFEVAACVRTCIHPRCGETVKICNIASAFGAKVYSHWSQYSCGVARGRDRNHQRFASRRLLVIAWSA
jgi:hypothetical protein